MLTAVGYASTGVNDVREEKVHMRFSAVLRWLGGNSDALIALATAATVGVLGLAHEVSAATVDSAVLVALAALSLSVLRDRWHADASPDVRTTLIEAHNSLVRLPAQIERITAIDGMVADTRAALEEASTIRVLHGDEIDRALINARAEAREWIFRGGTATFVRAVALPECVRVARQNRRVLTVRMEILDPTNHDLCRRYTNYFRHGVEDPNEDERGWTTKGTQVELFATILAACWWKQHYPPLEIAVALSSTMTVFRWDMSQSYLFITERGPRFPAMMIKEGRFYYDYWRNELAESFNQARPVPLHDAQPLSEQPTIDETRDLFLALGMRLPDEYTDKDVERIVEQALSANDPYA
jgi:hypothetical protein